MAPGDDLQPVEPAVEAEVNDDPYGRSNAEPDVTAPEAEQDVAIGGEEGGVYRKELLLSGEEGRTALVREEELQFSSDPEIEEDELEEEEQDDVETVRKSAAKKVRRSVRPGQFQRALHTATPPIPPQNPPTLETSYEPQYLPSQQPQPLPTQPQPVQEAEEAAPEPEAEIEPEPIPRAEQARQRGFVRYQQGGPGQGPIPLQTAQDNVYDLPDQVWRSRPTLEPGGLTMPPQELLTHPNTEVIPMDVDDLRQLQPRNRMLPRGGSMQWRRSKKRQ